jgi:chemotaxis methyl-accepting protein methylase
LSNEPSTTNRDRPLAPALRQLVQVMQQTHGRDVSGYDEAFLAKSFERRQAATTLDAAAYLACLAEDGAEAAALFQSLNINYSEFFRNPLTFAVLEQLILPRLADQQAASDGAAIRVWSAACSAGQEAYSIAILVEELAAARSQPVPFRIIATDVSEPELVLARTGVYNQATMQNIRLRHLGGYFSQHGETHAVAPELRARVDFSVYDLLDEHSTGPAAGIYGDFDLIACCNVLLYYRQEIRRVILNKLRRCLSPGGFLVTGEAERAIVEREGGLCAVAPPAAVFRLASRGP